MSKFVILLVLIGVGCVLGIIHKSGGSVNTENLADLRLQKVVFAMYTIDSLWNGPAGAHRLEESRGATNRWHL